MERETRDIILPVSGKTAKIKTFLTAREKIEINRICAKLSKVNEDGSVEMDAETLIEYQSAIAKAGIVSLDGESGECFERLLDLRFDDYKAVVEEVIKNDSEETEKKLCLEGY